MMRMPREGPFHVESAVKLLFIVSQLMLKNAKETYTSLFNVSCLAPYHDGDPIMKHPPSGQRCP